MKYLEAVARRWVRSENADQLIFRGSLVTGIWIGRDKRPCDDIDFLATFPFDDTKLFRLVENALSLDCDDGITFDCDAITTEAIFMDSDFPGCRITVPASSASETTEIQIDVGFNDPLPFGPVITPLKTSIDTLQIPAPCPEVGFAWKLHGLVEKEGFVWRVKDLADLWLIANHCSLDTEKLDEAISIAFESRDGPLWRLDRLFAGNVGHSRGSRKEWEATRERMPNAGLPETIAEACDSICPVIEPHWWQHRVFPELYASNINLEEIQQAVDDNSNFEAYSIPEVGTTFVYRHLSSKDFPYPLAAATETEFRKRLVLREIRGITFSEEGKLISRPFPKFDPFNSNDISALKDADTYEKLDGSLVFPTPCSNGFIMRTRRGPSEISQQAQLHAESSSHGYSAFIEHCNQNGLTPMFEWCSRQHRIILDHPQDKLVLTSIRRNDTGSFLTRPEQEKLAGSYQIPLVEYLGKIEDPAIWLADIRSWKDREGCIVHTKAGEIVKVKSIHYKRLHQAIEGPKRDRARWQLILNGDGQSLAEVSQWKSIALGNYQTELFDTLSQYAQTTSTSLAKFPDRKTLAEAARQLPGIERQIYFRLYQHTDPVSELTALVQTTCDESLTKFNEVTKLIGGPLLND